MRLLSVVIVGLLSTSISSGDEQEDAAVKLVEKAGGSVTRNEKTPGKPVIAVKLKMANVGDVELKVIAGLKHLVELNLNINGKPLTAAGLKELNGLKELKLLELAVSGVKDGDYKELGELTQLEVLNLWGTTRACAL